MPLGSCNERILVKVCEIIRLLEIYKTKAEVNVATKTCTNLILQGKSINVCDVMRLKRKTLADNPQNNVVLESASEDETSKTNPYC